MLFCHPALCVVLAKLFQLMMLCGYIPGGFRYSFIVPIPKPKECFSKSLGCDDFRGIAISPILSKVFEYCVLEKYNNYLSTTDNQFGFKKALVVALLSAQSVMLLTITSKVVVRPIFAPSTCRKHLIKLIIMLFSLNS